MRVEDVDLGRVGLQVGAGAERAAAAGEDDRADLGIGLALGGGALEVEVHVAGEGVQPVGPVERDPGDAVAPFELQRRVGHRAKISNDRLVVRDILRECRVPLGPALGLIVCVALWGSVFIGVHELLPELDPLQIVTLRFAIIGAVFAVLLAVRPDWRPRIERREWLVVFVAAICAVPASQLPIIDGQRFLSPPIAALVVTFAPAIAAVLAAIAYRERLAARSVAGFAIALGGVAMIVVLGAGTGAQAEASDPLRASLALLSPLAWAIYTLISKPLALRHQRDRDRRA